MNNTDIYNGLVQIVRIVAPITPRHIPDSMRLEDLQSKLTDLMLAVVKTRNAVSEAISRGETTVG